LTRPGPWRTTSRCAPGSPIRTPCGSANWSGRCRRAMPTASCRTTPWWRSCACHTRWRTNAARCSAASWSMPPPATRTCRGSTGTRWNGASRPSCRNWTARGEPPPAARGLAAIARGPSNTGMTDSFLFYDLETFGADPRRSRIAQFAAVRTDRELQVVDEPISLFVRPADDLLPSPVATLITGIAPQHALREGLSEAEAAARIVEEMSRPGTCTLGYNSLRFDDEYVRHTLFRDFFDPYEREWRGGNSRWDLLDVMRLAHALRPEGIEWPKREDGATSFKLEHLA